MCESYWTLFTSHTLRLIVKSRRPLGVWSRGRVGELYGHTTRLMHIRLDPRGVEGKGWKEFTCLLSLWLKRCDSMVGIQTRAAAGCSGQVSSQNSAHAEFTCLCFRKEPLPDLFPPAQKQLLPFNFSQSVKPLHQFSGNTVKREARRVWKHTLCVRGLYPDRKHIRSWWKAVTQVTPFVVDMILSCQRLQQWRA